MDEIEKIEKVILKVSKEPKYKQNRILLLNYLEKRLEQVIFS